MNIGNGFRQPRDLLNRESDSPTKKESTYSFPGDFEEVRLLKIMVMR
jgi:hypothetical protein